MLAIYGLFTTLEIKTENILNIHLLIHLKLLLHVNKKSVL